MQGACTSFPLTLADDAAWRYYDLAKSRAVDRPPAAGELCVWLVTSEFRFASASNVANWLSAAERKRARLYPNSAIGRRFGVARATLRLVVSQMLGCRPEEVQVEDGPDERIVAADPRGRQSVHVDVAYSGIWIVIAVGSASVGVGLSADTLADAAHLARARAERGEHDTGATWHGIALPMPGEIRGVVAAAGRLTDVQAFGWEKPAQADAVKAGR
ncbi:hypothetical protein P9239_22150 [Caballeronia sp. LZ062]|uniref:4'-phosphopantetheinyl transferase family protein n=1 Tax=unclassified Caballeronia TaxID=2646786 RepID=UPI00286454E3|nr:MULTISPECIES: hypothetical protein [unclassified Caballeronia]MDR5856386.1 hypothetical protein [Caballeronia sp. LZ050]MDR5873056.1 hypothetical protein [Caballeronia sp. LZ062]